MNSYIGIGIIGIYFLGLAVYRLRMDDSFTSKYKRSTTLGIFIGGGTLTFIALIAFIVEKLG